MALYSYSFANKKRDLTDVLSTVIKDEPRFISNFKRVEDASQQKHEWLEDQIAGRAVTATAVSSMTVTASAGDVMKIKAGTLLVPKNDSVLFKVVSVDSATTFTVTKAVSNGSSKIAPSEDDVLNIVSSPMAEGSGNGDGEESYQLSGTNYNSTQIFRKDIVLTGSALAINVFGSVDNQLNRQTAFALGEAARDLNRVALFGRRVEGNSVNRGETGGLYFHGTQGGCQAIDAGTTALDSFIINDAAQTVLSEGGNPTQILCSPGQARVLSNEFRDKLQIVRSDEKRGAYVAVVVNEINGRAMTIMADPDMPDSDAWIMDIGGFGLSNLKGRALSDEDATPKGFDGIKRMALGELTLEFKNARQRLCRVHGLKPSLEVLAAIRAQYKAPFRRGSNNLDGEKHDRHLFRR
ncbi:MAG: DUF5309 domain-containing protein [Lentisphaerae bacterium]|nr:DUF5309 domain-containing protein [Lentisphaerota bacterium]MCP4101177.1 DUF5309 domain-containing protein [Lentisphaerota bacterium]